MNNRRSMINTQLKEMNKNKTLAKLAFDGGNGHLKWAYSNTLDAIPSWGVLVDEFQDLPEGTLSTTHMGETWAFGQIARELGGQPLFELGKETMTPILLKALLESTGYEAINELNLLVPDKRSSVWQSTVQPAIEAIVPTTKITFINEGEPAYRWAKQNSIWQYPNEAQAILDCGYGDMTLTFFTKTGVIDWNKSFKLPGTNALAQKIANKLAPECVYDPSPGAILNSIEDGTFEYIDSGNVIPFYGDLITCQEQWINDIRARITRQWQSQNIRLGGVMLVGGGARLLEPMIAPGRPYFIAENPQINNFHQLVNAYAMSV